MNEVVQHTNRRSSDMVLLALVQKVHDDVKGVKIDVLNLSSRLDSHMKDETLALAEAVASLVVKSFPEGDPDGHKAIHEADIKAAKEKAEFWVKMRFELSRAGLIGFLIWVTIQIWRGALAGPQP